MKDLASINASIRMKNAVDTSLFCYLNVEKTKKKTPTKLKKYRKNKKASRDEEKVIRAFEKIYVCF